MVTRTYQLCKDKLEATLENDLRIGYIFTLQVGMRQEEDRPFK